MKKCLCIIFALMLLLTSCNHKPKTEEQTSSAEKNNSVYNEPINWNDSSVYNTGHEFTFTVESDRTESEELFNIGVNEYQNSISFSSVEVLKFGLKSGITDEMITKMDSQIENDENTCKEFIKTIREKNAVMLPYYKDGLIPPTDKDCGYCSLFGYAMLEKPGLYFPIETDNDRILITTVFIDKTIADKSNQNGPSWLIEQLSSKFKNEKCPTINNYKSFDDIKIAYESQLPLGDRVVNTLILEYNYTDYNRITYEFVYDDIFVSVSANPEIVKNGFLKDLSFKPVSLD